MKWFIILFIFILFFGVFSFLYFGEKILSREEDNYDFNLNGSFVELQFEKNLRFETNNISYRIENNCDDFQKNQMYSAFEVISSMANLSFYPVYSNELIYIYCDGVYSPIERLSGEGGPTEYVIGKNYSIIKKAKIRLLKDSNCKKPNVAIHELLHVLGFQHSLNPKNIMYEENDCKQWFGKEIRNKLKNLYAIPSFSDLEILNLSYIETDQIYNFTFIISNSGIAKSSKSILQIDDEENNLLKQIEVQELEAGNFLKGVAILNKKNKKIKKIKFIIIDDEPELDKENNQKIILLN